MTHIMYIRTKLMRIFFFGNFLFHQVSLNQFALIGTQLFYGFIGNYSKLEKCIYKSAPMS